MHRVTVGEYIGEDAVDGMQGSILPDNGHQAGVMTGHPECDRLVVGRRLGRFAGPSENIEFVARRI